MSTKSDTKAGIREYFKNFEIKEICHICEDFGFFIHFKESLPSPACMRDDTKRRFECCDHSGFKMKQKLYWYKFRVANTNTGYWEYYQTAKYEQGTGLFEDFEEVKELIN